MPFAVGYVGPFPHGTQAREYELMIRYGMKPLAVPQGGLLNGAKLLGLGGQIGELDPNYHADIIAVPGSPLYDVTVLEHVTFVVPLFSAVSSAWTSWAAGSSKSAPVSWVMTDARVVTDVGIMTDTHTVPLRFGDGVRVRIAHPIGYLRGKAGTIERICGSFPNPEELAYRQNGFPARALYRVRFRQRELWPDYAGEPTDVLEAEIYQHWLLQSEDPAA